MTAFVNLPTWTTLPVDDTDHLARANFALSRACERIRQKLCQHVDLVENDIITLAGTNTRALILPELPVVNVASVTSDGDPVTDFTVDNDNGLLWRNDPGWWPRADTFVVTYDHGFATIPDDIAGVAFELAARYFNDDGNPGVQQESIDDYSVTYSNPSADELLTTLAERVVKKVPAP